MKLRMSIVHKMGRYLHKEQLDIAPGLAVGPFNTKRLGGQYARPEHSNLDTRMSKLPSP